MLKTTHPIQIQDFMPFDRVFLRSANDFTVIGNGEIGGKAHGLAFAKQILRDHFPHDRFPEFTVGIPKLTVITTQYFDAFMRDNDLYDFVLAEEHDQHVAMAFQSADLSPALVGDLYSLISQTTQPLAIRSSSLLEDAKHEPFAGIYETKMIPNNQFEPQVRFEKLVSAIKFVYASTFFQKAREYQRSTGHSPRDEKMAVIIQEVIGQRHDQRFYPTISGVGRSYNYYRFGHAKPEDGVVNLALGLGKQIVDGGVSWTYCPRFPRSNPPTNSLDQLIDESQRTFWAVNMGKPPMFDPVKETEYLLQADLATAESDGVLGPLVSTCDFANERLLMGVDGNGPRVLTFSPLLIGNQLPLNELVNTLLKTCETQIGSEIEIEFAVTLAKREPARFGFLQVRPMVASHELVEITPEESQAANLLASSENVLGNGVSNQLRHVVYVKPESFDLAGSPAVATQLAQINRRMLAEDRPYVLIGFGRWGSSDPWLGIPVTWGQISGARVIVEGMLENMNIDLSQGSHFFHNLNGFQVSYFSVRDPGRQIDWEWLARQTTLEETAAVRAVELPAPLLVKVDGRTGQGVIIR